ncbi:MAG: shikimate dehydrogenase [Bacteroidota bacterium]|nr:shikimate dehydrogenase [Bacteroidota bacterium]
MQRKETNSRVFGLIGKDINYSFSKNYFLEKFKENNFENYTYKNFDIHSIELVSKILNDKKNSGLNVTIPYKKKIIPYLDRISNQAKEIGAVNTIFFDKMHNSIGYNTDAYGFEKSLLEKLKKMPGSALILGTGGASLAISYALKKMDIKFKFVSRKPGKADFSYSDINLEIIQMHPLIINTTPLGTFPEIKQSPILPYDLIGKSNILYDLTYNPLETLFLKKGKEKGCITINGLKMLTYQAEKSWEIWNQ